MITKGYVDCCDSDELILLPLAIVVFAAERVTSAFWCFCDSDLVLFAMCF